MEATLIARGFWRAWIALACTLIASPAFSAQARTQNFFVTAATQALAQEIAHEAERFRKELAISWLGRELPPWSDPCPVRAKVDPNLGAGGATSFLFETESRQFSRPTGDGLFQAKPAGRPFGWEMTLQGSRERILDSVLPHEITHTIFATHFGRPLPRWADEGACTTVEHASEKEKQHRMLYEFLTTERGIPFNSMFAMTEYPKDILPLYSQGFALARFFINQGGRRKFVDYIGRGLDTNDWTRATEEFYGFESISELQVTWLGWVRNGGRNVLPQPQRTPFRQEQLIASNNSRAAQQSTTLPIGKFSARSQPDGPSRQSNSSPNNSWYARQKHTPQSPSIPKTANVSPTRRTGRPDRSAQQREVLLEWGRPSDLAGPRLAQQAASTLPR